MLRSSIAFILSFFLLPKLGLAADNEKSLLWRVSGKDLDKPSYVFGTIHLICPEDYIWTDKMQQSLQKADEVCFEMDLDDPSVMMTVAAGLIDNSGKTLEDYFSPQDYKKLSAYIKDSLGMSIGMFSSMKLTILPMIFTGKSQYCAAPVSYEERLMQSAKEDKKEVRGIEKPEEQIELFNSLPADSVVKDIMQIVNGTEKEDDTYERLINAYKSQDLPKLYELLKKSEQLAENIDAFVDERNIKWIPRMVDMMDQRSMFFAVGAGHLWGENGVINLLKKEGYTVEPVQ